MDADRPHSLLRFFTIWNIILAVCVCLCATFAGISIYIAKNEDAGGNDTVAGGNDTVAGGNDTVAGGNDTVAGDKKAGVRKVGAHEHTAKVLTILTSLLFGIFSFIAIVAKIFSPRESVPEDMPENLNGFPMNRLDAVIPPQFLVEDEAEN